MILLKATQNGNMLMSFHIVTVPKRFRAPPSRVAPAGFVPPAARAVLALEPGGCRWPLGALDADDFRFCNARHDLGSAYCAVHRRVSRAGDAR